MPTYWYLSAAKLAGLGASDPGLFGRIRTKAKLGVGGAGLEIGLDPVTVRRLDRAAAKAETDLRRKGKVADVSSFRGGPPPAVYFSSQGPACRAVVVDMFWTATIDDDVAVLLVGGAANAIGTSASAISDVFSPSADPVGAVRHLLDDGRPFSAKRDAANADPVGDDHAAETGGRERAGDLAYAWAALMDRDLALAGDDIDALPRAVSLSQYVTRHDIAGQGRGWRSGVRWLVFGSPVYVRQDTVPGIT